MAEIAHSGGQGDGSEMQLWKQRCVMCALLKLRPNLRSQGGEGGVNRLMKEKESVDLNLPLHDKLRLDSIFNSEPNFYL